MELPAVRDLANDFLSDLSARALASPRLRQNHNLHADFYGPCQRFFNAIEPGSCLRPHRQRLIPRDKLFLAVRGRIALLVFNNWGRFVKVVRFSAGGASEACGAEVPAGHWNTVLALEPGSVLLKAQTGPFDPDAPCDLAPWAPEEGSEEAAEYFKKLVRCASKD